MNFRLITTLIRSAAAMAALAFTAATAAPLVINVEEAAEIEKLDIQMYNSSEGVVYGRMCDHCERRRLTIDANTQISRLKTRLTLEQAVALGEIGATVLFDPATNKVTRIIYWY